jgi:hypothetical protein
VGSSVGFSFNRVFQPDSKNLEVYQAVASDIVDEVMNGTNGTIFAYGSTGSGKTYTMMGEGSQPGITPLAVDHIFKHIEGHPERTFVVEFSYFEIYNEKVYDLLNERAVADVRIRYTQQRARSARYLIDTIIAAETNRATGATSMNEHSSRSHAIVRISIDSYAATGEGHIHLNSVLNLVDLAGSECQKNTNAEGDRQHEASKINKSLLALSRLIDSLQSGKTVAVWRESKLTLYLQNSIGGNSLTTIICAINSDLSQKSTSEYTLRFASKAMKVRNQPKVNQVVSDKGRIEQLTEENRILKERLELYEAGNFSQNQNDDSSDAELPRRILSRNAVNVARRLLLSPSGQVDNDWDVEYSQPSSPSSPIELPKRKSRVVVDKSTESDCLVAPVTTHEIDGRDEETQVDIISDELESLNARASELETEKLDCESRYSELDSEHSEFAARIRELESLLSEKEHLLENASHVSAKLEEQQNTISDLRTRLTLKEAELKGANLNRTIIQGKLEQKDVTLIQFGERIQSQREEIDSLTSQVSSRNRELNELKVRCEVLSSANLENQRTIEEYESQKRHRTTQETETTLTNSEINRIITTAKRRSQDCAAMFEKLREMTQAAAVSTEPPKRGIEDLEMNQIALFERPEQEAAHLTLLTSVVANELPELKPEETPIARVVETQTDPEERPTDPIVWQSSAAISEIAFAFAVVTLVISFVFT